MKKLASWQLPFNSSVNALQPIELYLETQTASNCVAGTVAIHSLQLGVWTTMSELLAVQPKQISFMPKPVSSLEGAPLCRFVSSCVCTSVPWYCHKKLLSWQDSNKGPGPINYQFLSGMLWESTTLHRSRMTLWARCSGMASQPRDPIILHPKRTIVPSFPPLTKAAFAKQETNHQRCHLLKSIWTQSSGSYFIIVSQGKGTTVLYLGSVKCCQSATSKLSFVPPPYCRQCL